MKIINVLFVELIEEFLNKSEFNLKNIKKDNMFFGIMLILLFI